MVAEEIYPHATILEIQEVYGEVMQVYTVSALTRNIKILLEDSFPTLWVEGEISNYKPHYSGHLYFTLKDAEAQIACVMWRNRAETVGFEIKDGSKIRVLGNVKIYEKAGRYQLDILSIIPAGIGELQILFEQLKQKLLQEGLFDKKFKKEIPRYPETIGIITSPTGAAIKDMVSVIKRRSPSRTVLLYGVKVQGAGAAEEIAAAIQAMNRHGQADVLIVGRGGGSLEDLWPFNEEIVARAIFESRIPIISAVGHEIDFTIADFVADLRAPTPSAAAEVVSPDETEISRYLQDTSISLQNLIKKHLTNLKETIGNLKRSYGFRRPTDIVSQYAQRLDELIHRFYFNLEACIVRSKDKLTQMSSQLQALNPDNIINRGYSLLFKDDILITSVQEVSVDDRVDIQLKDGKLLSRILKKYND
jgi:exodeoxyribonuclease VII large subunit